MMNKKNKTKINVLFALAIVVSLVAGIFVSHLFWNKDSKHEGYNVDSFVAGISDSITVERLKDDENLNVSEALEKYSNAIAYRPVNDVLQWPEYLNPDKVVIDAYDSIILMYKNNKTYEENMEMLSRDKNTFLVESIDSNTITYNDPDFKTDNYEKENSYAAGMLNSRAKAAEIISKGVKRHVTIGVIDTGLYSKNSTIMEYVDLNKSYDFVNGDTNVLDGVDNHATCVISSMLDIIGGDIAKDNISIINAKVLENGTGRTYSIYQAIMALANQGCDIINISCGGPHDDSFVEYAVNVATSKGIIVVCSAGNCASNEKQYPASYENAISVSAIDRNGQIASFSSYGGINVSAPGVDILTDSIEYTMETVSGTSISAPIITGALTLAMLEDDSINNISSAMNWLKKVARDLGSSGYDEYYGYGVPVFEVEEPTNKPEEPTTKPEEPTTKPEEPTTKPEEPTTKPEEPTTKPEEPTTKPEEPTTKPEEPTTKPEEPTTKPEEPTTKPEEPTTKPEEPTTRPEEPTTKPEEPTTKPEKPTDRPVEQPELSKVTNINYEGYSSFSYYTLDGHLHLYNAGEGKVPSNIYTFDGVEGAAYYEIWYADYHDRGDLDKLDWRLRNITYWTGYSDNALEMGMDILIKVRAVDENGNKGPFSEVYEIRLIDMNPIAHDDSLNTKTGEYKWSAHGNNFVYYRALLYKVNSGAGYTLIEDGKTTECSYKFKMVGTCEAHKAQLLCYYDVILNGVEQQIAIGDDFSTVWRVWYD